MHPAVLLMPCYMTELQLNTKGKTMTILEVKNLSINLGFKGLQSTLDCICIVPPAPAWFQPFVACDTSSSPSTRKESWQSFAKLTIQSPNLQIC